MSKTEYKWDSRKMACIATYSILCDPKLMRQIDAQKIAIDDAGDIKLTSLPYFPKTSASDITIRGRCDRAARKFFSLVVNLYTNRKERPADSVTEHILQLRSMFQDDSATITNLAAITDDFFKFNGE